MKTFAEPEIVVFLGPSLPVARAREVLAADYRPPARQGDLYGVLASGVQAIVLIDGVFHGAPSVWQREILTALDEGIAVFGASSMGALRAAELSPFGMEGHGTIFEWYRTGAITGDDEVALQHADAEHGYRALSEPLVNLRATIGRAAGDGVIAAAEAEALIAAAKQTYYPQRSYRALIASAVVQGWPAERRRAFQAYLQGSAVDLKARDAASVLARCARAVRTVARRPAVDVWADEFARPRLEARIVRDGGRAIAWPELADAAARSPGWAAAYQRVLVRWFVADLARLRGLACPAPIARAFEARWRAAHAVDDPAAWARGRGLTANELAALLAERALVAWLEDGAAGERLDGRTGVGAPDAAARAPEDAVRARGAADAAARTPEDAAAVARIEALLAPDACPLGETPGRLGLVAAWARASGVRCPRAVRDALWTRWAVGSEAARRRLARRAKAPEALVRRVLEDRARAAWVLAHGPHGFGRSADLPLATVLELQLTCAIADLVPWQRAS